MEKSPSIKLKGKEYLIVEQIGKGGYGKVNQVKYNEEYFAIKSIEINDDNKENYKREIEFMININNPAIMKCHGFQYIKETKTLYILMDYMKNESLDDKIKETPIDFDNTNRQIILIGIAYGMKSLHNDSRIHRDLKPQNVLLDDDYYPKIADFGLSKKN